MYLFTYIVLIYSKEDYMSKQEKMQNVRKFIRDRGVCTIAEVMTEFNVTRSTAFRYLQDDRFLTSINNRGKFHIEITGINFNRYGLFNRDGKVFSINGNLLQTVVALISNSPEGMRASEVSRLVGTNAYIQCQTICRDKLISRQKEGRGYCYFSADTAVRQKQLSAKKTKTPFDINSALKDESVESLQNIIKILVAYVSNPGFTPKSIALSLTRRGTRITTEKVRAVFEQYGLAKKNS